MEIPRGACPCFQFVKTPRGRSNGGAVTWLHPLFGLYPGQERLQTLSKSPKHARITILLLLPHAHPLAYLSRPPSHPPILLLLSFGPGWSRASEGGERVAITHTCFRGARQDVGINLTHVVAAVVPVPSTPVSQLKWVGTVI